MVIINQYLHNKETLYSIPHNLQTNSLNRFDKNRTNIQSASGQTMAQNTARTTSQSPKPPAEYPSWECQPDTREFHGNFIMFIKKSVGWI